jgi:glycosyltransferase involved in cell wall biosynthesis
MKRKRVLLVYYTMSSFVKKDIDTLKKISDVKTFQWTGKRSIFKLMRNVLKSDITFSWFAADHAGVTIFFSKLFRKKSIVVVGGSDVALVPEINYGQFTQGKRKKILTKYALKNADKVLVVDPSLKEDAIKNANVSGENIEYLPTSYNVNYWKPEGKKEDIVLTVANINHSILKRKGLDTFVKAASYLPDTKFAIIGKHVDDSVEELRKIAPPNVDFTGFVSDEKLLQWYQKSKVYCQLSRYEGLPNSLCEAMLCGCIPVGTNYCGIPTAIGDTGFYVPFGSPEETADAIKKALGSSQDTENSRDRICKLFPKNRREEGLAEIVESL